MNEHPISNLMKETMTKIKEMVDVNTIIGKPIVTTDGTTVIPVSKVSFAFGSGGGEYAARKATPEAPLAFGGGGGAGVTVAPVCFLIIGPDGAANIISINAQASNTIDRLVEMLPGAINRISGFMEGRKGKLDIDKTEQTPQNDE